MQIPSCVHPAQTNQRRPILTVTEDTCGVHDTLISCCSIYRYRVRGGLLHAALDACPPPVSSEGMQCRQRLVWHI